MAVTNALATGCYPEATRSFRNVGVLMAAPPGGGGDVCRASRRQPPVHGGVRTLPAGRGPAGASVV